LIFQAKSALILAPHTDDGELGCGGTIARLVEEGTTVYYAAFSICEESVPDGFPRDILASEVRLATQVLGIAPENLTTYRHPVREFPRYRQEILDQIIVLRQQVEPDLVLLPSTDDIHQDHQVIAQEGIRAFKNTTLLGYELPWNNIQFSVSGLVPLQARHVQKKVEAMRQYKSQAHRGYVSEEFIHSLARVRGQQANSAYAEAFQVMRWILH
jgi:LmbE family N-acetylglucosaminyl deacetylase